MKIEKICEGCGKKFEVIPSLSERKYCTSQCYRKNKKRNTNEYVIKDNYCELHIKNKISERYVIVLISLSDVEKVKKGQWGACYDKTIKNYYIRGSVNDLKIQLHRYLTDCPKDLQVDHINRNTLDNRQENLRIVTNKENSHNKSQYGLPNKFNDKGINYHKTRKRYCVYLDGHNIGTFKTLEEADTEENAVKIYNDQREYKMFSGECLGLVENFNPILIRHPPIEQSTLCFYEKEE